MLTSIELTIQEFIEDNYLFRSGESVSVDDSLIADGLIDSMGILELVTFLEATFSIELADEDLVPENLDCIRCIAGFVERKRCGERELVPGASR